jgi:putative radical SAM enzyme (TIGR03279 family)
MPAVVNSIKQDSIAEELEISPKDEIISIDGIVPEDLIDYKFLISSETIDLHIKRANGEEEIIEIEKDPDEDLGITFESAVFDKVMPCTNKCVFCFVDQQPEGLRKSLYVKDDDYRLSYLQGTYITLTNLRKKDRERIERMRLGPLYVSVHTTNPDLRVKMLKNPKAANIMKELKWLNKLEIPVHTQIVVCPGLNDGVELDRTLEDLASLKSNVMSIAVVPVGITKFRGENELVAFTKEKAVNLIAKTEEFNRKIGYNLAFPSDEFYALAGNDFPEYKFYSGFGQLDDGVGTSRMVMDDFNNHKTRLPKSLSKPLSLTIATGELAAKVFEPIVEELSKISNLNIDLIPVKSNFWGEKITVSGLITGKDLIENLMPHKDKITNLLIPSVMIRKYTDTFLDDTKISDAENALETKIFVVENYYSTKELVDFICSHM